MKTKNQNHSQRKKDTDSAQEDVWRHEATQGKDVMSKIPEDVDNHTDTFQNTKPLMVSDTKCYVRFITGALGFQ